MWHGDVKLLQYTKHEHVDFLPHNPTSGHLVATFQGLQSLKRWITGQDGYKSDFRSISQANPSILSGSPVDCEEDSRPAGSCCVSV
jgi:hypothetical protein